LQSGGLKISPNMITLAGVLNVISQIEKDAKTTGDARLVKALQKVSKALGEPNAGIYH